MSENLGFFGQMGILSIHKYNWFFVDEWNETFILYIPTRILCYRQCPESAILLVMSIQY